MIPNVIRNGIFWEGDIELKEWNKFYEKTLNVKLNVGGDCIVDEVTAVHKEGYNYLISNQAGLLQTVIHVIFEKYSKWQQEYDYEEDERERLMPDISSALELKRLIIPSKIFIMDVEKRGFPFLGFQFECNWDEEHGVGVMVYKNRVVRIGNSDTAFMSWVAQEDTENI